jgi:16S rRNA (guanine527-N7)-methyltransferase
LDRDRHTDLLRQTSQEVGVSLSDSQIALFWLYLRELLDWSKRLNLTGIRDPDDVVIKHFIDSLTPLPYLGRTGRLLDIGSGAGFPGIPLKIAAPRLQVQLVDASRKKVSFLKHLIRTLELQVISVFHSRIEDMQQLETPFQIIISRAFRRLEPLLSLVPPLLGPGNLFVGMLGPTTEKEQNRLKNLAAAEGLEFSRAVSLELPLGRGGRTLLFFKKS